MATVLCFGLEALMSGRSLSSRKRAITPWIEAGDISVNIWAAIVAEHRE